MEKNDLNLSIIIPCFNEEKSLGDLKARLEATMLSYTFDWEVLLVNDGSVDKTAETIDNYSSVSTHFKAFHHKQNQGICSSWNTGLKNAQYPYILIMDADLQYPPEYIPHLSKIYETKDIDLVHGFRSPRFEKPRYRVWASQLFSWMLNTYFNYQYKDIKSGFLFTSKTLFSQMLNNHEQLNFFQHYILISALNLNAKIEQVPLPFYARQKGDSFIEFPFLFFIKALFEFPKAKSYFALKTKEIKKP